MRRSFWRGHHGGLALALAWTLAPAALANDTTARVAAGGIELLKSADVRMLRETLTISQKLVTVRYRFLNESDHDVHTTIAFPMPIYGWWSGASEIDSHNVPMTTFEVTVDGAIVPTRSSRRALLQGRDVTRELRAAGLNDRQIFITFGRGSDVYPDADLSPQLQKRVKQALGGAEAGTWHVEETRLWEQTFPAHREIVVEHRYAPFVGRIFGGGAEMHPSSVEGPERLAAEACVDADTWASVLRQEARLQARGTDEPPMATLEDVEYILGTGRNWKGPIADFTLRVEKARPADIVSLCFPGQPRRVSPTMLEFHQADFVPQDRLVVYFYSVN